MFADHITDNGLVSRIHKELSKLKSENKQSNQKMGKRHEQTLH